MTLGRLGRYELLGELAHGGMGTVFKGFDADLKRFVAIKRVRISGEGSAWDLKDKRQRFLQEARIAANLTHYNIIVIYEIDEDEEGNPFIAMELAEGPTLRDVLRLPAGISRDLFRKTLESVSQALDFAHEKDVIHRDIKPANIILTSKDLTVANVKICDFGIAKDLAGSAMATQTGIALGTPHYMAPEQVTPTKRPTAAIDQYGLAAVAYELLTGIHIFNDATVENLYYKILSEYPVPVERANPRLNPRVDDVLHKALAKDPSARWGSCVEFTRELLAACEWREDWQPYTPREEQAHGMDSAHASTHTLVDPHFAERIPHRSSDRAGQGLISSPLGLPVPPSEIPSTPQRQTRVRTAAALTAMVAAALFGTYYVVRAISPPAGNELPVIGAVDPAVATAGKPYSQEFRVKGGQPPYFWAVTGGGLPFGLTMNPKGVLSGAPVGPGTYTFDLTVVDKEGHRAGSLVSLTVEPARPVIADAEAESAPEKPPPAAASKPGDKLPVARTSTTTKLQVEEKTTPVVSPVAKSGAVETAAPESITVTPLPPKNVTAAPRIIRLGDYMGRTTGRIVWNGQLAAGGRVTIDGRQADTGRLEGGLEGVEKLQVTSLNPSSVKIVEAPSEQNDWRRLVLESNDAAITNITINWRIPPR